MRNQPLYILTEDLNFFYKLKNELDKYKIHFQILDLDSKIPETPSTILTTSNDYNKPENIKVGGTINREFIVKNCSWAKHAQELYQIYNKIIIKEKKSSKMYVGNFFFIKI